MGEEKRSGRGKKNLANSAGKDKSVSARRNSKQRMQKKQKGPSSPHPDSKAVDISEKKIPQSKRTAKEENAWNKKKNRKILASPQNITLSPK